MAIKWSPGCPCCGEVITYPSCTVVAAIACDFYPGSSLSMDQLEDLFDQFDTGYDWIWSPTWRVGYYTKTSGVDEDPTYVSGYDDPLEYTVEDTCESYLVRVQRWSALVVTKGNDPSDRRNHFILSYSLVLRVRAARRVDSPTTHAGSITGVIYASTGFITTSNISDYARVDPLNPLFSDPFTFDYGDSYSNETSHRALSANFSSRQWWWSFLDSYTMDA